MLIMCSKKDPGAYDFSKKLEKEFNIYLPKAKAKIARAPHADRIFDLLVSDQIPLAVLSYDLVEKLIKENEENVNFFTDKTKMIYPFSDMVLISNQNFPSEKSIKIYNSLIKLSKESSDKSFMISAKKGDIESIKQHIAFGTDLNSKGSSRDETALIIAACQGHYEVVKLLVSEGADLNIQNDEGVTAQFCAVFFGQLEIVEILSDAGADPNIINSLDLTAMDLVSVEWDGTRESAVKFYKLKYQVNFDIEDIKSAHPLIMDILNK